MANFMSQINQRTQILVKHHSNVSLKYFLDEINMQFPRCWVKQVTFHSASGPYSLTKKELLLNKNTLKFLEKKGFLPPDCLQTQTATTLPWVSNLLAYPAFCSCQLTQFHEPVPIKISPSPSLLMYAHVLLILLLRRTLTNTKAIFIFISHVHMCMSHLLVTHIL